MSQLPGIQLQMPGAVGVTELPYLYQETNVILPEARVDVGMSGLNLEVLGQAIGQYGGSILETFYESKAQAKMDALEALQRKAKTSISDYADINDFESVDRINQEYRQGVKELSGFDPFDPEFKAKSKTQSRLATSALSFQANVEDFTQGKKQGWQDTIGMENYEIMQEANQRELMASPDPIAYIDSMLEDQNSLFTAMSGGYQLGERLPETGFTSSRRNMLMRMNSDYTKLIEQRDKMVDAREKGILGQQEEMFKQFETRIQNQLILSVSYLTQADALAKKAQELDPNSEQAQMLRAQAHDLGINGVRMRVMAMTMIANERKQKDIEATIGRSTEESFFDETPELDNPGSMEAMTYIINSGTLSNETTRVMASAFDKENELLANRSMDSIKFQKDMEQKQKTALTSRLGIISSEAEARLTMLESKQKEIASGPLKDTPRGMALIAALEDEKTRILGNLRRNMIRDVVSPVIPKNIAKNPALHGFLKRQAEPGKKYSTLSEAEEYKQIVSSPSSFNIDFSQDSFKVLQGALFGESQIPVEIYEDAIKKINDIEAKFSDRVSGTSATYQERIARQKEEDGNFVKYLANQRPEGREFTSAEKTKFALRAGIARLQPNGINDPLSYDGSFPSLQQALKILEDNKDNPTFYGNNIPLSPAMIAQTPWFSEALELAMVSSSTPEEAVAKFEEIMGKLVGRNPQGLAWHDLARLGHEYHPMPADSPIIDELVNYATDTTVSQELVATAFLALPKESRRTILGKLEQRVGNDVALGDRIGYLQYISDTYPQQGSPSEYIKAQKALGITPFLLDEAEKNIADRKKFDEERKPSGKQTEQEEGKAKELRDTQLAISKIYNQVFTVLESDGTVTPQNRTGMLAILQNPDGLLMRTLITYATVEAWDDKTKTFNWQDSTLADRVTVRLKENWLPYHKWDNGQNAFVYGMAERTQNPVTNETIININPNITSNSGHDFGPDNRLWIVGTSTQSAYDESILNDPTSDRMSLILGQVSPSSAHTPLSYRILKEDGTIRGLVYLGLQDNRRVSENQLQMLAGMGQDKKPTYVVLKELVAAATEGMPEDNFTIMSAMAAVSELDVSETNLEKAKSFVSSRAKTIRSAIETRTGGQYQVRIVERPTNDRRAAKTATIQIVSNTNDKQRVVAEFQPNTKSVSTLAPTIQDAVQSKTLKSLVERLKYEGIAKIIKNKDTPQRTKDTLAVSFALNNDNIEDWRRVGINIKDPKIKSLILADVVDEDYDWTFTPVPLPIGKNTTINAYWKEEIGDGTTAIKKGKWIKNSSGSYTIDRAGAQVIYSTRPEDSLDEAIAPFGLREDGSAKGNGYFGPLQNSAGDVVTEYTITVDIPLGGDNVARMVEIPSLVPTLTEEEIQQVLDASANDQYPPVSVEAKAIRHAQKRMMENKSPFADREMTEETTVFTGRRMSESPPSPAPARRSRMAVSENLKRRKANPELYKVLDSMANSKRAITERRESFTAAQNAKRWNDYRAAIMRGEMSTLEAANRFEAGYPAPPMPEVQEVDMTPAVLRDMGTEPTSGTFPRK